MNILVTAGPTREPIDPVRFLTNRSSGKMGYEVAAAFAHDGHQVLLVSGPTALDVPDRVDYLPVETAAEMFEAVSHHLGRMDIAVFAAAVPVRPTDPGAIRQLQGNGLALVVAGPFARQVGFNPAAAHF